jgi:hypothetical protein
MVAAELEVAEAELAEAELIKNSNVKHKSSKGMRILVVVTCFLIFFTSFVFNKKPSPHRFLGLSHINVRGN